MRVMTASCLKQSYQRWSRPWSETCLCCRTGIFAPAPTVSQCAERRTAEAPSEPDFRIPERKQPSDAGDKLPGSRPEHQRFRRVRG